jgi:hypothetical protein
MGECSGWLCAVEQDCSEAMHLAPSLLGKSLGLRKGNERPSVYVYRSQGLGYKQYRDINNDVLVDIKASDNGKGHQIAVPPSIHPTKGAYQWVDGFDPATITEVPKEELRATVDKMAVATLITRHLPATGRHHLAMALAGYLLRQSMAPEDVLATLLAAWGVHQAPPEAFTDLDNIVRDTANKLATDDPTKVWPRTLLATFTSQTATIAASRSLTLAAPSSPSGRSETSMETSLTPTQ